MESSDENNKCWPLGQGLAILQQKDKRLHILNPLARWVWESSVSGISQKELTNILSKQTGHESQTVTDLFEVWAAAGLNPWHVEDRNTIPAQHCHTYWLGEARIMVESNDQNLLKRLHTCLSHLEDNLTGPITGTVRLCKDDTGYSLYKNSEKIHSPGSENDLIVQALWEIIEIGCRLPGRLMTVHGGAVAKDDTCCILAGAGGSGKTTLTAGLVASGFMLVADDVIPVASGNGQLAPVPMSMCIKKGSWTVLDYLYPEANQFPVYQRFGKTVRFYPPPSAAVPDTTCRFLANAVLFPSYSPSGTPQITPMAPDEILEKLVQTRSIIDSWTPEKLKGVSAWVSGLKGYRVAYPDLHSAMNLVQQLFQNLGQGKRSL